MKTLIATTMLLTAMLAVQPAEARGLSDLRSDAKSQIEQRIADARERIKALADEFDLTAQQKEEIVAVLEATLPQTRAVVEDMAANREGIRNAIEAESTDSAAIEALAAEQGDLFAELAGLRADAFVDIRAGLTEDQLGLLTEVRAVIRDEAAGFIDAAQARAANRSARRAALRARFSNAGDRLSEVAEAFGLTAAQRAEVRAIVQSSVPVSLEVLADMAANREAVKDAIAAEPADREAIDSLTDAQGELFGELVLIRAENIDRIRGVLTDDQLEMIEALRGALRSRIADFLDGV
jgi:Spy/CpxP family protein refolding chaperone